MEKKVRYPLQSLKNPFTNSFEKVFEYEISRVYFPKRIYKIKEPKIHKKKVTYSELKCIASGSIIEFIEYGKGQGVYRGFETFTTGKKVCKTTKSSDNINRTKHKLRQLVNANCDSISSKFVTLTYAENFQDLTIAKNDFKNFVKRWNYQRKKDGLQNLKYVYVVEFQERGAIHFHVIFFNLNFIHWKVIEKLWGNGFIKINNIKNCDNVGAYVVKYMQKNSNDGRLNNRDLYGRSKGNLDSPLEINNPKEVAKLLEIYKNKIVFEKTYTSDYRGSMKYNQVNLKR